MNLQSYYQSLYKKSLSKIRAEGVITDSLIVSPEDKRFGITLLIRPSKKIKRNFQKFMQQLMEIDGHQYYYPKTDMHVTVLSIISCYQGFQLNQIHIPSYIEIIKKSMTGLAPFKLNFKGITASQSALLARGFPSNTTLNDLRDNLRVNFRNSALQQSIDKRYAIQTAHASLVRFQNELKNKSLYLEKLHEYETYDFGQFEVASLELVYNDWYQKKAFVKHLFEFTLF